MRDFWSITGFYSIKSTTQPITTAECGRCISLYCNVNVYKVYILLWISVPDTDVPRGLTPGEGGAAKTELSQWHQALSPHSSLTPTHPVLTCRGEEMIKTGCFIACTLTHTRSHIVRHADANKHTYVDAASLSLGRQTAPHHILLNRGQQTYSFLVGN